MQGALLGPAFTDDEIERYLDAQDAPYVRLPDDDAARRASPASSPRARSSAGSRDAWSSGRARSAAAASSATPRSREDAVGHEPQDQVSRVVPAVRAVGARASASPTTSTWTRDSPYMLLVAPVREGRRMPMTDGAAEPVGHRAAQRAALGHSRPSPTSTTRRASRRSHAETNPRYHALLKAFEAQDRLRRARQHLLQRARRADRRARRQTPTAASCARRWTSSSLENCVLEKAAPEAAGRRRPTGAPSSSLTDGDSGWGG